MGWARWGGRLERNVGKNIAIVGPGSFSEMFGLALTLSRTM